MRKNSTAAFVCSHIAEQGAPILIAFHDSPVEEADSGWQFLCGEAHTEADIRIWAVDEVAQLDPTVRAALRFSGAVSLRRNSPGEDWAIVV